MGWDVNWVKSNVHFAYYSPSSRVYYRSGSVSNHWLIASGWVHDWDYFDSSWHYMDGQSRVAVDGDSHFTNSVFCNHNFNIPITDHVYYRDNRVVGTWLGTAWGDSDTWVSGTCATLLLHDEYVLEIHD